MHNRIMIHPYLVFQDRIRKTINSGFGRCSIRISGVGLEEEQAKYEHAEGVWSSYTWLRYCTLKSVSPLVKDDVLYFLHLRLM